MSRLRLLLLAIIAWIVSANVVAGDEPRFIRRSANADTVIIFVHGIMGDSQSTWTAQNGAYWPALLTRDQTFDGADIFVYSYPTGFWATLSIDELAENMRAVLISDGLNAYRKLVFVSHSMGGLVTRAYLLKNRDIAGRTAFAYFFSTPTTGSQRASIASPA
jgi:triacylglycerol esterase/lipase EstA (alpha/beta hydrolase family)